MRRLALIVAIVLSNGALARAQMPSNVDVMLGAQDVLHIADIITTSFVLTRGKEFGAFEGNPLLRPFDDHPALIATMSSTLDLLQVVVIKRVERKHPRWAFVWSAALAGLKVWATTNNIAAQAASIDARSQRGASTAARSA
jgi:hypothetical protein